jgi:hypothetical protein
MARDLTEHDIVARIMRKENYLIGMLNKGVLALSMPVPGLRRHLLLTKTLEWNLYWWAGGGEGVGALGGGTAMGSILHSPSLNFPC